MTHVVFYLILSVACLLVSACSQRDLLEVNRITVKDTGVIDYRHSPLLQMQTDHRMYGHVTEKERRKQLGQYYRIHWKSPEKGQATKLIFSYRRASKKGAIEKKVYSLPKEKKGTLDVAFIGSDFSKFGRILSWKAELLNNNEMIESKQSYLW